MNAPARSSYRGIVIGLAGLLLLQVGLFAAWHTWFRHDVAIASAPSGDVIQRMQEFTRQRRYDDAIQLGVKSVHNLPSDYIVLQQIALVCLRQAQIESGDRENWTRQAVGYADKAIANNPHEQANLYDSARVFEIAGDFSGGSKCSYYGRSAELFQERIPLLIGDQMMVAGKLTPTVALRNEQEYLSGRVKAKMQKNGCR